MCEIIKFERIKAEEIVSMEYMKINNIPVCRVVTDSTTKDFLLGDENNYLLESKCKKLNNFFRTLDPDLYPPEQMGNEYLSLRSAKTNDRSLFLTINHYQKTCGVKRILIKHGIFDTPYTDVVFSKSLGGFDIMTMITDWHGRLKKYVGKECAKELIDFNAYHLTQCRSKIDSEDFAPAYTN